MDYSTEMSTDTARIMEAIRLMNENNFGFDAKLQNSLDGLITKALAQQDELLKEQTLYIRGLEDEADQALADKQKCLEYSLARLERTKKMLDETQAEKVKASQLVVTEETSKGAVDKQVQELKDKALTTVDIEKNFPNQKRLQSLLYKATRVSWGKDKKSSDENGGKVIRGFVVNSTGTDVQTFELDKTNLDQKCVQDFVWDYVSAGIAKDWKTLDQP